MRQNSGPRKASSVQRPAISAKVAAHIAITARHATMNSGATVQRCAARSSRETTGMGEI